MKEKSSALNLPFFSCPRRKKSRILLFPVAFLPFCTVAGRKEPCDTNSYQKELYNTWEQTQEPQKLIDFGTDALLHELCILLDNSRKQKPGMLNPLIDPLKIAAGQHPERKASALEFSFRFLKYPCENSLFRSSGFSGCRIPPHQHGWQKTLERIIKMKLYILHKIKQIFFSIFFAADSWYSQFRHKFPVL